MTGESNLATLLKTMKPKLNEGEFVFCSVKDLAIIGSMRPVMVFGEDEGYTLILGKAEAEALGLDFSFVASWITLTVHSSLEAVGLTAAFSDALATENVSCNVVAGYFHDHIFVDTKDAHKAIEILNRLAQA